MSVISRIVALATGKIIMTKEEKRIYRNLKRHPGRVYIHSNGHEMYCLVGGRRGMLVLTSVTSFLEMSDEELNEFLQDALRQLIERNN